MTSTLSTAEPSMPLIKVTSVGVPTTWKRLLTMRPGHKRANTVFFLEDSGAASYATSVKIQYSPDNTTWYDTVSGDTVSYAHTATTSAMYTATNDGDDHWVYAPFIALAAKKETAAESMTVTGFFTM